ncbi:hypothetical protein BCR34DRAFT_608497 [Clohesyomyces aquaticus]|uniref:FAD/NAD(P)-binding domain-containing protein n=1 Tax=Clohesyomyces aquaticus TaxID=1231657 RepID=A0A1Y1Y6R3_9PLEO|nr:hypothetical protein BCR34DRAFT_608497 [Clohesyomyces aquaticus]
MKNIVILGGSFGGVSTAHRIFKSAGKGSDFKITLVSPNTDFYWNFAAPRAIVPGQFTDEQLFEPIATGFQQYGVNRFEFVLGSAESLDVEAKAVVVVGPGTKETLTYDMLVIATGSRTKDRSPWKGIGSSEETKAALHSFQEKVEKAEKIVVAGAGPTGVEIAGELAFAYGAQKEVVLLTSGRNILPDAPTNISNIAKKALEDLKVPIKFETKVVDATESSQRRHTLTLSSGNTLLADLYIPTFGITPNSSFIPPRFLDSNSFVVVDSHLNLAGDPSTSVWALGDISNVESAQFIPCNKQSVYVAKSIVSVLNGKKPGPYKPNPNRLMGLQIGKKTATGHYGKYKIPSFVVTYMRKDLFTPNLKPTVDGSWF